MIELRRTNNAVRKIKKSRWDSIEALLIQLALDRADKADIEAKIADFDATIGLIAEVTQEEKDAIKETDYALKAQAAYDVDLANIDNRITSTLSALNAVNTLIQNDTGEGGVAITNTVAEKQDAQSAIDGV